MGRVQPGNVEGVDSQDHTKQRGVLDSGEPTHLKFFSMFSGVGGFEIGIKRAYENSQVAQEQTSEGGASGGGWNTGTTPGPASAVCVGFSEIDKHASAVLRYHYAEQEIRVLRQQGCLLGKHQPDTHVSGEHGRETSGGNQSEKPGCCYRTETLNKNYGDCTKINWSEVPDFDLLVGGSPCQDFSIAGKRAGLVGARSGLAYEYIRALEEKRPAHFIWENVRGVLSSNRGWDFAAILNQMAEAGYTLRWEVLNARNFGVPQNRERVFVVGCLSSHGGGSGKVFPFGGADKEDNVPTP